MENLKNKIVEKTKDLEVLVLEVVAKAKLHRRYPHFEVGDRCDKAAIYINAAITKLCRARDALRD